MADVGGTVSITVGPPRSNVAAVNRRLSIREFGDGVETDEILVDVFPSDSLLDISVTNGSIGNPVERIESVIEFLTFNDASRAQLRHGDIDSLTITKIGDFRNVDGTLLFSNIAYDAETSELVLSQDVFGIVKVTYQAPFQRFIYVFSGDCPAARPAIDPFTGEEEEVFERATIIAKLPSSLFGVSVATLVVENPNDRCPFEVQTGEPNNLILEIVDQDWSNKKVGFIEFESRIRVFPSTILDLVLTIGRPAASITFDQEKTLTVSQEPLQFSGSSSASIRYPIDSFGISNNLGGFLDEFGKEFPADADQFKQAGERVTRGTWNASDVFTPSGEVTIVKKGEVYVTDPSGNERPVTGIVTTDYEVTFNEYIYEHEVDEQEGGLKVVAKNDIVSARSESTKIGGILPIPQGFKTAPNFARQAV